MRSSELMISNDKLLGAISRHDRKSPKRRRFGNDSKNVSIRLSWHLKGLIIKLIVQAQDQLSWQKFIKTFSRKICIRSEAIEAWKTRGGCRALNWKGIPLRALFFLFLYYLKFEGLKWTRQNDYKCPYWKCYRANNDSRQRSIFF